MGVIWLLRICQEHSHLVLEAHILHGLAVALTALVEARHLSQVFGELCMTTADRHHDS